MSELQKALRVMGLDPGASKESIATRYKRLIMVWHPDRFPTADGKADAEEELKKINNAKDVLYKHFDSGAHRTSGCECQAGGASSGTGTETKTKTKQGGAAEDTRSTYDAEEEARRRDQERRRKASEAKAESERKQREEQEKQAAKSQQTFDEAQRQQAALKDSDLRWKVAIAQIILYFGLIGYAWTGYSLKSWWHDVSYNWQKDHPSTDTRTDTNTSTSTSTSTTTDTYNPFGDPKPPPENNPNMLPNGVMKPLDNSKVPIPRYPSSDYGQYTSPNYNPGTTTSPTEPTSPSTLPDSFKWKPVSPITPSPSTTTTTTTTTTSSDSIDLGKYINH